MADDNSETDSAEADVLVANIVAAVEARDTSTLLQLIVAQQFVLISVTDQADADDEEAMGAITAEVNDDEVLVAFTSEPLASEFVESMSDMFDEGDQIQGFIVEGDALLEYLPDDFGLLLNPETVFMVLIDAELARQVIANSTGD